MSSWRRHPFLHAVAVLLAGLAFTPEPALPAVIRSPHTAEACLDCHRNELLQGNNAQGIPTIILPDGDDPHRVLLNSCIGCHSGGVPAFWLMVFPKKKPPAAQAPQAPKPVSAKPTFANSHDKLECGKCHKQKVSFNSVTGAEKDLVGPSGDISVFCQRCHQETSGKHFPRGNIPVGETTCLTCHRAHRQTALPSALREDYYSFIRQTRDVNPHGGAPFCLACHPNKPLSGEPPEFIFGEQDMGKLCQRCHPQASHHVVDRPATKKTWKMDFLSYPLSEGKITCVTCHDQHCEEEKPEGVSKYSLRGEPYAKMTDFCQKCHDEKGLEKINPHDQLTPDGEIISRSCLICHTDVPDASVTRPLSASGYNDSLTAVCSQCHEPFPHPEVDHLVLPTREMATSVRNFAEKREVVMPFDFDGRITCVTCHNPHEKGLLEGPEGVGADEEKKMRLTTLNEICTPCHGRH